jgi:hypothetical protein
MVIDCLFDADGECVKCTQCGFVICNVKLPVRRRCDVEGDTKPGLGDMVKSGLSAIGITKERVSKAVGGDCGCSKRQEQLNELGRKLGIG